MQERQGIEQGRVENDRQPGRHAEQSHEQTAAIARIGEALDKWIGRNLPARAHILKDRAFLQLRAHPHRCDQKNEREQQGDAPAPCIPGVNRHGALHAENNEQRENEAARHRRLNEAGVEAGTPLRRIFGHIDGRTAIFAAQGKPLTDAEQQNEDRSGISDRRGRRHEAHARRRNPHQDDGREKSIFAAELVAQIAENDRAERTEAEAHRKASPGKQHLQGFAARGEEGPADDPAGGKRAVDEEIIPFEDGAERRCANEHRNGLRLASISQSLRRRHECPPFRLVAPALRNLGDIVNLFLRAGHGRRNARTYSSP